jgi:hypothetical protein
VGASTSTERWALGLTATAAFMVALDQLVVATALDRIRADLHAAGRSSAARSRRDWPGSGSSG